MAEALAYPADSVSRLAAGELWRRDPLDSAFELWALSQALAMHTHQAAGHLGGVGGGLLTAGAWGARSAKVRLAPAGGGVGRESSRGA